MSPLEGWVHHIDYMFIHLSCMHWDEKWVPYESITPDFERETQKMKSVLAITFIFKKSWSLWRQAWLASSLLEQILKNNSGEVPSNRPSSLFKPQQWLNPKKLRANMVKSLNTIQHFCKSFFKKADRRGIAPQLQNGACSCYVKK